MYRVLMLLLLVSSCSVGAKLVSPDHLKKYESDSSFHNLWYMGSDEKFHYFKHVDKYSTKYKVDKSQLNWSIESKYGELEKYILVLPGTIEKNAKQVQP